MFLLCSDMGWHIQIQASYKNLQSGKWWKIPTSYTSGSSYWGAPHITQRIWKQREVNLASFLFSERESIFQLTWKLKYVELSCWRVFFALWCHFSLVSRPLYRCRLEYEVALEYEVKKMLIFALHKGNVAMVLAQYPFLGPYQSHPSPKTMLATEHTWIDTSWGIRTCFNENLSCRFSVNVEICIHPVLLMWKWMFRRQGLLRSMGWLLILLAGRLIVFL